MIRANHKRWARMFFSAYIDHILKKDFSHFYIVNEAPEFPPDMALLVTPNHISWWDGFIIDHLNRRFFKHRAYVMMLEEQLKKYSIFSRIGAYSINPGNMKEIKESLSYTAELLSDRRNLVIFFPEGVLKPFDINPSPLKKGMLKIAEVASKPFAILPAAVRISHYNERHPEIYVHFGQLICSGDLKNNFDDYEISFKDNIKSVNDASLKRSYLKDLFK